MSEKKGTPNWQLYIYPENGLDGFYLPNLQGVTPYFWK